LSLLKDRELVTDFQSFEKDTQRRAMGLNLLYAIPFPDWLKEDAFIIPFIDWPVKWYGISYIVGIGLAYYWAIRTVKKREIWQPDGVTRGAEAVPTRLMLDDFVFYCLLGIIVGGRLGNFILYEPPSSFLGIFKVWEGGMAFHGGFVGVCIAVWYISKKHDISLWRWADTAAIGAPLGLFCVRIANFINQELYGRITDVPWAVKFWKADFEPRHPSQLYEAFLEGIVIFAVIWYFTRYKKALTKPGLCAGLFFLLYGVFRIFVEFFRIPDIGIQQISDNFTWGIIYSIPMVIIGIVLIRWAIRRPPVAPKFLPEPVPVKKKKKAA